MTSYRVFQFGGRPVLAVPSSPLSAKIEGLKCFQPHTVRRSAYRHLVSLVMRTRLEGLLSNSCANPTSGNNFEFARWLEAVGVQLGFDEVVATVIWPPQTNRGRFYVHLFDPSLRHVGFAKVSLTSGNDVLLRREAATLRLLEGCGLHECRVPKVLITSPFAGHQYLVLEALPREATPLSPATPFPETCVREFAGQSKKLDGLAISELSWWPTFIGQLDADDKPLLAELEALGDGSEVEVNRAHGDFGLANMVIVRDHFWIYDWEASSEDAPSNADALSFELDVTYRRLGARSLHARRTAENKYLEQVQGPCRAQALLALAYLRTVRRSGFSWLTDHGTEG